MDLIPPVTPWHDSPFGPLDKGQPTVSLLCPLFSALSGSPLRQTAVYEGREGSTKSHCPPRGKGRGWGRFRKLPSEILLGGKRVLPPPWRLGLRLFSALTTGDSWQSGVSLGSADPSAQCRSGNSAGLSLLNPRISVARGDQPAVERRFARGRRRLAGSGTASARRVRPYTSSTRQLARRRRGRQTGSPPPPPA